MAVPKVCLSCCDGMEFFDGSTNCPSCSDTLVPAPLIIKVFGEDAERISESETFVALIDSVEGRKVVKLIPLPATKCANCGKDIDENTMTICSKCLDEPVTACTKNHTHGKGCMQ